MKETDQLNEATTSSIFSIINGIFSFYFLTDPHSVPLLSFVLCNSEIADDPFRDQGRLGDTSHAQPPIINQTGTAAPTRR